MYVCMYVCYHYDIIIILVLWVVFSCFYSLFTQGLFQERQIQQEMRHRQLPMHRLRMFVRQFVVGYHRG